MPTLTLLENVLLPMDLADRVPMEERLPRAVKLLADVGLADVADAMPDQVSGGQQQSAAIARALANDPPLLVADEPTGNLDTASADRIMQLFESLVARGKTVIMVTHDQMLAARSQRTLLLSDGEVVSEVVMRALPYLSDAEMLRATHSLVTHRYAPGDTILAEGAPNARFYLVREGSVDVTVSAGRESHVISRLGPGAHFGEAELLHRTRAQAGIRASDEGDVELATLDAGTFEALMEASQAARAALVRIADERHERAEAARRRLARGNKGKMRRAATALA